MLLHGAKSSIQEYKVAFLLVRGFIITGRDGDTILLEQEKQQATVDVHGRVLWYDKELT